MSLEGTSMRRRAIVSMERSKRGLVSSILWQIVAGRPRERHASASSLKDDSRSCT